MAQLHFDFVFAHQYDFWRKMTIFGANFADIIFHNEDLRLISIILLAPYSLFLRLRHFFYDHGLRKIHKTDVPSICLGNITVGGTGKTPHTEMLLRILSALPRWRNKQLAVLSRGYMRKSSGFLEVTADGSAKMFGDEPLQIKKKFPNVVVAVDKDRIRGCKILCGANLPPKESEPEPEWSDDLFAESNRPSNSIEAGVGNAKLIILDDAFQYRRIQPNVSLVMVDYNHPVFKDSLLPLGRLRDLPYRLTKADMVIVSKCPSYLNEEEMREFTDKLGYKGHIFFTSMFYDEYLPVFPEGDCRYTHAPRLILVTGIADDKPLYSSLSLKFEVVKRFEFGDHHRYKPSDFAAIRKAAEWFSNAVIMTTEKDAQRILDCPEVPQIIMERLFCVPVRPDFLSDTDSARFTSTLSSFL